MRTAATRATSRNSKIPESVQVIADLADAVYRAPIIILAVPAKAMRTTARALSGIMRTQARHGDDVPLVLSAAKGLDPETGALMSQVLAESLGDRAVIGAISGPNIRQGGGRRPARGHRHRRLRRRAPGAGARDRGARRGR